MQNHHLESVSTCIQKTARQIFFGTGPIWGISIVMTISSLLGLVFLTLLVLILLGVFD